MFLTFKRKSIIAIMIFVFAMATICVLVSRASTSAYNVPKIGKTIVIDAGHGGRDGGVSGINTKTTEADLNLIIAKKLRHFLLSYGYDVVMTRTGSDGLYGLSSKNKKMDDLQKRKAIINNAQPDLAISIHQNYFPISSVRGAQAFYAPTSEKSKAMADIMQSTLNANLVATSKSSAKGDYYILQCTEYPSLLVECGFLSNVEDEKLLVSAEYQEKVAYTIFSGINSILLTTTNETEQNIA